MKEFPLMDPTQGIPLFYPYISKRAIDEVQSTLDSRWIGQGPKVERFEDTFKRRFLGEHSALAVGSGTDALHLAYLLAGIKPGDEVLVPVFTCTATNIPLLYIGAVPIFCDIDPLTMNVSIHDIERKVTSKTKAVVTVDYGGIPCDYSSISEFCQANELTLISDAAHSLGSSWKGRMVGQLADFTIFSFQAIKTISTGDGGLLSIRDPAHLGRAKRLRWFGIDREAKQGGVWENDIVDIGYKYQMTDIAASLGLTALEDFDYIMSRRRYLFSIYEKALSNSSVKLLGSVKNADYDLTPWLATVIVSERRLELMTKLRRNGIESAQVHYRNDRYGIFHYRRGDLPMMDELEERYLVLPLHLKMSEEDVLRICDCVNSGW